MPDDTVGGAVVERFVGYLRQHNLPVTAQRLAIAEVLLASDRHLSAEEVAGELSKRGQKVGTATVYRAIDTLLESGLLVERDFGEGFRRFEPARDIPHHEHLVCTQCGKVEEVLPLLAAEPKHIGPTVNVLQRRRAFVREDLRDVALVVGDLASEVDRLPSPRPQTCGQVIAEAGDALNPSHRVAGYQLMTAFRLPY